MNRGLEKFYELVEAFESLPSIGKKSALRLAYYIVMNDNYCGIKLSTCIENAIKSITKCKRCGSMSEHEICEFCLDENRESEKLCIVQSAKDIFIIEDSKTFDGRYFVIDELEQDKLDLLEKFIINNSVKSVLFAITPTIANDAFILFIESKLKQHNILFTKIAQGVPTGVSLENVDILSLSKAIQSRVEI
jgi:recombination protein RecR